MISGGDPSLPPKIAVPAFIALTNDAETQAAAKTIGEVLWDDLEFEKEFYMIPRDTYRSIPQPAVARSGRRSIGGRSWARTACSSAASRKTATGRDGAVPADQRGERHVGDGQGIQRQRAQHSGQREPRLRAHHRRRTAQGAARAERHRPHARSPSRPIATASASAARWATAASRTSTWRTTTARGSSA